MVHGRARRKRWTVTQSRNYYSHHYADQEAGAAGPESEATFALRVGAAVRVIGKAPRRILDFGCGTGAAAQVLTAAGHEVVGVDVSESGLRLARRDVPSASFELIDAEDQLPFSDAFFDICFSTEVIEHLLNIQGFIKEIHRVLRPGGLFLLTTPYHGRLKNLIIIMNSFDNHFSPESGHIRFFSKASLTKCLVDGGFEVQHIGGIGRFWPIWKSMFVTAKRVH